MKWADNSPCKGEVKGGSRWLRHRHLLITSNDNPMDFCRGADGCVSDALWEPVRRRFKIIHVTKDQLPEENPYIRFDPNSVRDNPWCSLKEVLQGHLDEREVEDKENCEEERVEEPSNKRPPE